MKWINAEQQVTVNLYNEEHEEYFDEIMTVEEMLDAYTNEGCPTMYINPERKGKWIPVSEKPPEEAQECWITAKDGTVWQGMFTRRYGERQDTGFICHGCGFAWLNAVAAWMPYELPEPYREEGE